MLHARRGATPSRLDNPHEQSVSGRRHAWAGRQQLFEINLLRNREMNSHHLGTRRLGNQGLAVSTLGLGCMGLSDFYASSPQDEASGIAVIQGAIDAGVTLLDTADMYGPWTNEQLLGKAIAGRRDGLIIATKFGVIRDPNDPSRRGICGKPDYVRASCEASLKRLGLDCIDLYYQHRVDRETPIEDTVGAMADLVRQGKVRYLGLSEAGPTSIRRAHATHPISAVQTEYSLWSRDVEDEILPTLRELGIGLVPYSPLGRGFLAGRFKKFEDFAADDFRRTSPRFEGENFTRNLALVEKIESLAQQKGCTPSQLALAWLLTQGPDIVPIPGTSRIDRLQENLGAATVELSSTELLQIDAIAPKNIAAGGRYSEAGMQMLGI